jgi:hypothetical protein
MNPNCHLGISRYRRGQKETTGKERKRRRIIKREVAEGDDMKKNSMQED